MNAEREADGGDSLAMRLSNAMVKAQKQYFGKGPLHAKSYLVDDLLFIVMREGMTRAEETMLDFDQADKVRDFRQTFENEMTERLTTMIEDITGRRVLTYQSQILFDPNLVIEIFVFDKPLDAPGPISAEATNDDTLDRHPEQPMPSPAILGVRPQDDHDQPRCEPRATVTSAISRSALICRR